MTASFFFSGAKVFGSISGQPFGGASWIADGKRPGSVVRNS